MQRAIAGILLGVASVGSMEVPADLMREGISSSVEVKGQGSIEIVQKILAPLREDAQRIETNIKTFDAFLQQPRWDEKAIKMIFVLYQNLDEEVDIFPLKYRSLLDRVRREYRADESVDSLIRYHTTVMKDITFSLCKYFGVMFDVKSAYDMFIDVRLSLRDPRLSLGECDVSRLRKYQHWSCGEYKGLQQYFNGLATVLLIRVEQRQLLKKHQEEMVEEEERLNSCVRELEEWKHQVYENVFAVEQVIKKPVIVDTDMQELSARYEELSAAKKRLEVLKESSHSTCSSVPKNIENKRKELVSHSTELHENCSLMVARCEQLKISELRTIFTIFATAEKDIKEKKDKKPVEDRWFLAEVRRKWMVPFPPYYVQQLSGLLGWNSDCKPLQTAVRDQAKKYLQQSEEIGSHSAVQQYLSLFFSSLLERLKKRFVKKVEEVE